MNWISFKLNGSTLTKLIPLGSSSTNFKFNGFTLTELIYRLVVVEISFRFLALLDQWSFYFKPILLKICTMQAVSIITLYLPLLNQSKHAMTTKLSCIDIMPYCWTMLCYKTHMSSVGCGTSMWKPNESHNFVILNTPKLLLTETLSAVIHLV